MKNILLILFLAGSICLVFYLTRPKKKQDEDDVWPFYAKRAMTKPEQITYSRLVQALPDKIVLAQVQLSRLLGVKKGHKGNWLNRINRMSADFVVCRKDSSIISVIELDDKTHEKEERQFTDQKKDKALLSAGIPMIRWNTKSIPDIKDIQSIFKGDTQ